MVMVQGFWILSTPSLSRCVRRIQCHFGSFTHLWLRIKLNNGFKAERVCADESEATDVTDVYLTFFKQSFVLYVIGFVASIPSFLYLCSQRRKLKPDRWVIIPQMTMLVIMLAQI